MAVLGTCDLGSAFSHPKGEECVNWRPLVKSELPEQYRSRRTTEQLDQIADADIEFRACIERISDAIKNQAYGTLTKDQREDLVIWLIDAKNALTHLGVLESKYWPCGCTATYVNNDCAAHCGPC